MATGALLLGALCPEVATSKVYMWTTVVLAAIAAVALAVDGAHFAGLGRDIMPFACGAVIAVAGAVVAFLADKKENARLYAVAFALVFVGVAVARYAFYSVV